MDFRSAADEGGAGRAAAATRAVMLNQFLLKMLN